MDDTRKIAYATQSIARTLESVNKNLSAIAYEMKRANDLRADQKSQATDRKDISHSSF